jgi:hypothetical protein
VGVATRLTAALAPTAASSSSRSVSGVPAGGVTVPECVWMRQWQVCSARRWPLRLRLSRNAQLLHNAHHSIHRSARTVCVLQQRLHLAARGKQHRIKHGHRCQRR